MNPDLVSFFGRTQTIYTPSKTADRLIKQAVREIVNRKLAISAVVKAANEKSER